MIMINAHAIIKNIGRKRLSQQLGVKYVTVSAAAVSGRFPAAWYPTIQRLAAEYDLTVPDDLFNWRVPQDAAVLSDEVRAPREK